MCTQPQYSNTLLYARLQTLEIIDKQENFPGLKEPTVLQEKQTFNWYKSEERHK